MGERVDYADPLVWSRLAVGLQRAHEPFPTGDCGQVRCGPTWSWRFDLADYDLWLVTRGRGRGLIGSDHVEVRRGTLLVLRPGDTGSLVHDPDDPLTVTYAHFAFRRPGTSELVDVAPEWLPSRHIVLGDLRAVHEPLLDLVRLLEQRDDFAAGQARLVLHQVWLQILQQDAEAHGHGRRTVDPRVQAVMRYVRERPSERPTARAAAEVARVSPASLRRLFARELGMSLRTFVLRSRMERARALLSGSTMSVAEIARALGYTDVALFSRQVRGHFGMPPRELRGRDPRPARGANR